MMEESDGVLNFESNKLMQLFPIRKISCFQFDLQKYKKLFQLLNCTICNKIFDNPSFLRCSHRFCKDCIQRNIRRKQKKCCPICGDQLSTKRNSKPDLKLQSLVSFAFGDANGFQQDINRYLNDETQKNIKFHKTKNGLEMQLKRQRRESLQNQSKLLQTTPKKKSRKIIEENLQIVEKQKQKNSINDLAENKKDLKQQIPMKVLINPVQVLKKNLQPQTQKNVPKIIISQNIEFKAKEQKSKSQISEISWLFSNFKDKNFLKNKKKPQIIQILSQQASNQQAAKSMQVNQLRQNTVIKQPIQAINVQDKKQKQKELKMLTQNEYFSPKKIYTSLLTNNMVVNTVNNQNNVNNISATKISGGSASKTVNKNININQYSNTMVKSSKNTRLSKQKEQLSKKQKIKNSQQQFLQTCTSEQDKQLIQKRAKLKQSLGSSYLKTLVEKCGRTCSILIYLKPKPKQLLTPFVNYMYINVSLNITVFQIKQFILQKLNLSKHPIFWQVGKKCGKQSTNQKKSVIQNENSRTNFIQLYYKTLQNKIQKIINVYTSVLQLCEKHWKDCKGLYISDEKDQLNLQKISINQNKSYKILYYCVNYYQLQQFQN